MKFDDFLIYLHNGAFASFQRLLRMLSNFELKSLRLVCKPLTSEIFPYMFSRIYVSAHESDLEVFKTIVKYPQACRQVREIMWDDTTFDMFLRDFSEYKDYFDEVRSPNWWRVDMEEFQRAHTFWKRDVTLFQVNQSSRLDVKALGASLAKFTSLKDITILSRSRLTYVDPDTYWSVWQTPRSRRWRAMPFSQYLLSPKPFRPEIGATNPNSEGIRPMGEIIDLVSSNSKIKVTNLRIESIGGGQTRASGGMNSNRYDRKWHIDLDSLTEWQSSMDQKGKLSLNILLETQTEDLWRQAGIWETNVWIFISEAAATLEEITLSAVCLDWLWHSILANATPTFTRCEVLRKLKFNNCWCSSPFDLLLWLRNSTTVRDIHFAAVDMEAISWPSMLAEMRQQGLLFDAFDLERCRSPGESFGIPGAKSWVAPWHGSSKDIIPWLREETDKHPLWQGPG